MQTKQNCFLQRSAVLFPSSEALYHLESTVSAVSHSVAQWQTGQTDRKPCVKEV